MLPRRQVLAASATTLPLSVALGSLGTLSACAGHPNPLKGPPPLSADVRRLLDAAAAEENLVYLYEKTIAAYSPLAPQLSPVLADHRAHLRRLEALIVEPPGRARTVQPARRPAIAATQATAVTALRAAERAAITAQLRRLTSAPPAQAQLYASIAAAEAVHLGLLPGQQPGSS
jgi:hypothetical protein